MENKDLYKILEIDRNATQDEIKKAYRKLSLRYHPDRQGDKSDAEKKEAEEKFKSLSFAYSILSDPEKKQRYDQYGITDDQQMGGAGFDASDIFKHFMGGFDTDMFGSFFDVGGRSRRHKRQDVKGQSIQMTIPVSIEEILCGIDREVKYDIQVRCDKCNGEGGTGIKQCPHCHGSGQIVETSGSGWQIFQTIKPCPYCNGTGKTMENKCSSCGGTGFKTKETSVDININRPKNGQTMYFKEKGYQSKSPNMGNGDLLIQLQYNYDTNKYRIDGDTIYERLEVPYYDCILGKDIKVKLPDHKEYTLKIPKYTSGGNNIYLNTSINGWKYGFIIDVKMPKYINKNEVELLEKIREENK